MAGTASHSSPIILVVMGVSGSGKSTIAAQLAQHLGWDFAEGDLMHPQTNIDKMSAGVPLTDVDRRHWLEQVAQWAESQLDAGTSGVITCSALKRSYRQIIGRRGSGVLFIYLSGTFAELSSRLTAREGHFMPMSLLKSQFDALEEPGPDEPALTVDVAPSPEVVTQQIIDALGSTPQRDVRPPQIDPRPPGTA